MAAEVMEEVVKAVAAMVVEMAASEDAAATEVRMVGREAAATMAAVQVVASEPDRVAKVVVRAVEAMAAAGMGVQKEA